MDFWSHIVPAAGRAAKSGELGHERSPAPAFRRLRGHDAWPMGVDVTHGHTSVPADFRRVKKRSNRYNRQSVQTLTRLLGRLETDLEGTKRREDLTERRAEVEALRWALQILQAWIADDPLFQVVWLNDFTGSASLQQLVDLLGCEAVFESHRYELAMIEPRVTDGVRGALATLRPLAVGEQPQRAYVGTVLVSGERVCGPEPVFPARERHERQRLRVLEDLHSRLDAEVPTYRDQSRALREVNALGWALDVAEEWVQ